MKGLVKLTSFNLKYYFKPRFESKKQRNKFILLACLLGFCFITPLIGLVSSIFVFAINAAQVGKVDGLLSVIFTSAQVATIFFGLATYVQIMYFSKDNEIILTLPVDKKAVFLSKLAVVYVSNLLVSTLIILPSVIVTAIALSMNNYAVPLIYYFLMPVAIFILPVLPLLLTSLISFPIMKLISYFKKHPLLGTLVLAVFIVTFIICVYIPIFSMQGGGMGSSVVLPQEIVTKVLSSGNYMYNVNFLSKAMMGINWALNTFIFLIISIGSLGICLVLAHFLYSNSNAMLVEGGGIQKNEKAIKAADKQFSKRKSYVIIELKSILRNTSLSLNSLMSLIMVPIFVFLYNVILSKSFEMGMEGGHSSLFTTAMCSFFSITMLGGTNMVATMCFSREGNNFQLLKTYPISIKEILWAKLRFADIVSLTGTILSGIVFAATTKGNIIDMIMFVITIGLFCICINAFAVSRDLKNPKLNWINVKELTKNNFSSIIPMLISMPAGLVAIVVGTLLISSPLNEYAVSSILWGVLLALAIAYFFIFRFKSMERAQKHFEEIEV